MIGEAIIVGSFLVLVIVAFSLDIYYSNAPYRRRKKCPTCELIKTGGMFNGAECEMHGKVKG